MTESKKEREEKRINAVKGTQYLSGWQTVSPSNTKTGSNEETMEMHTADNQNDVERKERNPRDLDHNPIVIQF